MLERKRRERTRPDSTAIQGILLVERMAQLKPSRTY
jgi:hypothetical protein